MLIAIPDIQASCRPSGAGDSWLGLVVIFALEMLFPQNPHSRPVTAVGWVGCAESGPPNEVVKPDLAHCHAGVA